MNYHDFDFIDFLPPGQIFVFGSNLGGIHGKGAALTAKHKFGAVQGVGEGLRGQSYALPTKLKPYVKFGIWQVEKHVKAFLEFARSRPELTFVVTAIACGEAGFTPKEIAPMFLGSPDNVILPRVFEGAIEVKMNSNQDGD